MGRPEGMTDSKPRKRVVKSPEHVEKIRQAQLERHRKRILEYWNSIL